MLLLNAPNATEVGNTFDSWPNEVSDSHTEIGEDFAAANKSTDAETDDNHLLEKPNGDFIHKHDIRIHS